MVMAKEKNIKLARRLKNSSLELEYSFPHKDSARWHKYMKVQNAQAHAQKGTSREGLHERCTAIALSKADMDFAIAPGIQRLIGSYAKEGCFMYTLDKAGIQESVLAWMGQQYDVQSYGDGFVADDVQLMPTVLQAVALLLPFFSDEKVPYIAFTPLYPPLLQFQPFHSIRSKGAKFEAGKTAENHELEKHCVEVPLLLADNDYKIDYVRFEQKLMEHRAKVLIFCNPHNPMGKVWPASQLRELLNFCAEKNVSIISDEVFADHVYTGKHIPLAALERERHASVNAKVNAKAVSIVSIFSTGKTFNIPALQCASMIFSSLKLKKQAELSMACFSSPPLLHQKLLVHAYGQERNWYEKLKVGICENRDYAWQFIEKELSAYLHPFMGDGTYLIWLRAEKLALALFDKSKKEKSRQETPWQFFEKAGVVLLDGQPFGRGFQNYLRLNVATNPEWLQEALLRMKLACARLS